MTPLDPKKAIPEFQARIKMAETCEDMLSASMAFIQFNGGFSGSPETRAKFTERMTKVLEEVA